MKVTLFDDSENTESNAGRKQGRKFVIKLGCASIKNFTNCIYKVWCWQQSFVPTMPEYLEFLINFWDKVNNVT